MKKIILIIFLMLIFSVTAFALVNSLSNFGYEVIVNETTENINIDKCEQYSANFDSSYILNKVYLEVDRLMSISEQTGIITNKRDISIKRFDPMEIYDFEIIQVCFKTNYDLTISKKHIIYTNKTIIQDIKDLVYSFASGKWIKPIK